MTHPNKDSQAERAAFEAWARKACNMPPNVPINWDAVWTMATWEGWQAARQDQQPARASVDTVEFRAKLMHYNEGDLSERELIAHINAWGGVEPKGDSDV